METGIELIKNERYLIQVEKYGFTGKHHADHPEWYSECQLVKAASFLTRATDFNDFDIEGYLPTNWNLDWWGHMCRKPYFDRIVIAGALLAAELDRLLEIEERETFCPPINCCDSWSPGGCDKCNPKKKMRRLRFIGIIYNSSSYCGWKIKPDQNQIYSLKEIYRMLYGSNPINNKENHLYDCSLINNKDWQEVHENEMRRFRFVGDPSNYEWDSKPINDEIYSGDFIWEYQGKKGKKPLQDWFNSPGHYMDWKEVF